jgi:hypothetical protein
LGTIHVELSIEVAAPVERTWGVVADVERWPLLTPSMTSARWLDGGRLGMGAKALVKQPRMPAATWTVCELEPGRAFGWRSTLFGATTIARHRVDPAGERACVLALSVDVSGPLTPLFGPLVRRFVRRFMAMEANGIMRAAESPS